MNTAGAVSGSRRGCALARGWCGCCMASNVGAAVRSGVHGWMECVRVAAGRQSDRERGRGACGLCGADLAQVGGWWCVGSWYVCPAGPLMMVHQSAGRACLWRSVGTAAAVGLGYVPTSACKGLYIRLHCLRTLCPLQEHTTFNESLVCYTSPPGGVYVLDVIPGVSIIRSGGCRGRSGGCLLGLGRPARSTGPDCPDSQATCDRHSHSGFCPACKAAGYSGVRVRRVRRLSLRDPCWGIGLCCPCNAPRFLLAGLCWSCSLWLH